MRPSELETLKAMLAEERLRSVYHALTHRRYKEYPAATINWRESQRRIRALRAAIRLAKQ